MQSLKKYLIFALLLSLNNFHANEYQNIFGSVGAVYTPSARFHEEGTLSIGLARDNLFSRGNLLAQPYEWLEVSIFYADIPNKPYKASLGQSYKDKGFNTKVLLFKENEKTPQIAIGLSDFAGTGLFSGEYLVASKNFNNFDFSIGIGWGVYGGFSKFKNPFTLLNASFESRNSNYDNVGELDSEDYFSGKQSSLFSSIKYKTSNGNFIVELGEITLAENRFGGQPDNSKLNLGYRKNFFGNLNLSLFLNDEKSFKMQLEFNENFSKIKSNNYIQSDIKDGSQLLKIIDGLQKNAISLKELYINKDNNLVVGIRQNAYSNVNKANKNTLLALDYALESSFDEVIIKNYYFGEEISMHGFSMQEKNEISHSYLQEKKIVIYEQEEPFPQTYFNLSPRLATMVASREEFLHYGLLLDAEIEHYFFENFFIDAKLSYSLTDNFDRLFLEPITTYPAQVRSDIKKYLNQYGKGIFVEKLQANYLKQIDSDNYISFKGGILERMFMGYGFEYLNVSKKRNFAFGADVYSVHKRDYDMRFSRLPYETVTGHLNLYSYFEPLNLTTHISYGKYLAGDKGFTFDFSRRFENGTKFGAFFTLTDVSSEQFGEGSFDKGIYFSIPFGGLSPNQPSSSFLWRPLTKDPGQKLNLDDRLFDLQQRYLH